MSKLFPGELERPRRVKRIPELRGEDSLVRLEKLRVGGGRPRLKIERGKVVVRVDRGYIEAVYEQESIITARSEFFDTVQRVAPEAFTSLFETDGNQDQLDAWQQRWNLTAEWCAYAAFHTVNYPDPPPFFIYPEFSANEAPQFKPPPGSPPFDPTRESAADYKSRLFASLTDYQKRSLEAARNQGFDVGVPDRRRRQHFVWLAAYQILGLSINLIAEAAGKDRVAVRSGIKSLAKLIGLPLRPAKLTRRPRGAEHNRLLKQVQRTLS